MKRKKISKMEHPRILITKLESEDRCYRSIVLYEDWTCHCPACLWGIRWEKANEKEDELTEVSSGEYSMYIVVSDASLSIVDTPVNQRD